MLLDAVFRDGETINRDGNTITTDKMATRQQQPNDGPLFMDKEGVVHYNGDPVYGEEFEERANLGYHASEEKLQKLYAMKINNSLNGREWNLTSKRADIATQAALDTAGEDQLVAVKLAAATVREACKRIAPLQMQQAFEGYFFKRFSQLVGVCAGLHLAAGGGL
eukprot:7785093-Pyramimonas_sp.AAC.1